MLDSGPSRTGFEKTYILLLYVYTQISLFEEPCKTADIPS